jgi:hypothetical protein
MSFSTLLYSPMQQYDPFSDHLYRNYLLATVIGVGLSFIVIGMLIWQNVLTRKAVKAAQSSSDALKTIERPWLLLTKADRFGESGKAADGSHENRYGAQLRYKNFGKTPALIDGITGGAVIIQSLDDPFRPTYKQPYACADELVAAPGDESGDIIFMMGVLSDEEWHRLTRGESFLVMFGEIKYSDTFGGDKASHISRFCYRYTFNGSGNQSGFHSLFGSKEYNIYT